MRAELEVAERHPNLLESVRTGFNRLRTNTCSGILTTMRSPSQASDELSPLFALLKI